MKLAFCAGDRQTQVHTSRDQKWPVPRRKERQGNRMEEEVGLGEGGSFSYFYPNKSHVLTLKVVARRS